MKQLSLFFLSFIFMGQQAFAQTAYVQINPFVGWTTSSALETYYGKIRTTDGINYGANLSFGKGISGAGFTRNAFLELQYSYLNTDLEYRSYSSGGFEQTLGKIAVHNAMIGGTKGGGNGTVEGYGGYYFGATIYDPEDNQYSGNTAFTMSLAAGMKYAMSPKVGLRLHAQMYMPIWGSNYYVGWGGSGVMATAANIYANFNLGLYINLGGGQ